MGSVDRLPPLFRDTARAALRAFPVYTFVRSRDELLWRARSRGVVRERGLYHASELANASDREITTPNDDTLYSTAFVDLSHGPLTVCLPALPTRYHSVAVMDARTDHAVVLGTRDGERTEACRVQLAHGDDGKPDAVRVPTREAWILVRTLVDGPTDLAAAREAQRGFRLEGPESAWASPPSAPRHALPVRPDPATLLDTVADILVRDPSLRDTRLFDAGYGRRFDTLSRGRRALWHAVLPLVFRAIDRAVEAGSRTDEGWSRVPPGIGTRAASDEVRAGVALVGFGALPADEAVYRLATHDALGSLLEAPKVFRLRVPANVPARAFWSVSLYERLPDGRLFYVDRPDGRHSIGNRSLDLLRDSDGSVRVTLASEPARDGSNWLATPRRGRFVVIFRAYLPEPALADGRWKLPPICA